MADTISQQTDTIIINNIQEVPPEIQEIILKHVYRKIIKKRLTLGWNKVHDERLGAACCLCYIV